MQIAINNNQTSASAVSVNITTGSAVSGVDGAENNDSVAFAPVEEVSISDAGRRASKRDSVSPQTTQTDDSSPEETDSSRSDIRQERESRQERAEQKQQEADLAQVRQLKSRDAEVKAHEAAHAAVGGQLAGTPSYTYQRGPDGVRYAVAGEVPIDVGVIPGDPQATLEKMQQVQRAALAPAEPSSQDRQVAALAAQQAAEARAEISSQQRELRADSAEQTSQEQKQAEEEKEKQEATASDPEDKVPVSEVFSEQNARMRRINEFLLDISVPDSPKAGDLINAVA